MRLRAGWRSALLRHQRGWSPPWRIAASECGLRVTLKEFDPPSLVIPSADAQ
jgi:hypothetical protein